MERKLVENDFWTFQPRPHQTKLNWGGVQHFLSNEKNQSCSGLPEMAKKLNKNDFFLKIQPPPKKGVKKKLFKNEENQYLLQIA